MDWDEPNPVPNEKMQPIQWTERPTGALVAVGSLWPFGCTQASNFTKLNQENPVGLFLQIYHHLLNLSWDVHKWVHTTT